MALTTFAHPALQRAHWLCEPPACTRERRPTHDCINADLLWSPWSPWSLWAHSRFDVCSSNRDAARGNLWYHVASENQLGDRCTLARANGSHQTRKTPPNAERCRTALAHTQRHHSPRLRSRVLLASTTNQRNNEYRPMLIPSNRAYRWPMRVMPKWQNVLQQTS